MTHWGLVRCLISRRCDSAQVGMFLIGLLLILQVTSLPPAAFAQQSQRSWITFRDRGPQVNLSLVDPQTVGISEHALWRRAKVLPPDKLIDELDLPVYQSYLDQLRSAGIVIRTTSRWFNAASAELTSDQRASLANMPSVASVEPVAVSFRREPNVSPPAVQPLFKMKSTAGLDYGPSLTQLSNIKVIDVHNQGITGAGVIMGMLDDGFNQHMVHPALKNIKVIAEYDFVQRDSNTSRAPGEFLSQGDHGAGTLSVIGGFDNGKLIGAAFGASFVLAKTEVDSSGTTIDFRIEEDFYVEGLEWEERLGAEIVSSSLGYNDFLDGPSYTYQDMNGKTATTTKAARIAARKGVSLSPRWETKGTTSNQRYERPVPRPRRLMLTALFQSEP